ncbi:hypothetical protein VTO73DRAFT_11025 [Trametes versicolor]
MGVLGLAPFLQKTCPEVVKTLPDRLKSLAGKKVVIDGTLITQRFHFAPFPHAARHVLGWYRLIKHLQHSNVEAICVFDGKERSAAKEREVERRRKDRKLTASRGTFEVDRLSRLRQLTKLLHTWRHLGETGTIAQQLSPLKNIVQKSGIPALPPARISGKGLELNDDTPIYYVQHDQAIAFHLESPRKSSDADNTGEPPYSLAPPGSLADISQLYEEYKHSIPHIPSLAESPTAEPPASITSVSGVSSEDVEEAQVEYALSKNQHNLMMEEGRLWQGLAHSDDPEAVESILRSLAEELETKSSLLSESYDRRTHPPTSETYEQSKEILQAMGVPYITPSGPFEAEALAASLVIHGYADYVASEDTDVLVYEAPLIRNITSSSGPLVLISGADVRTFLQLDRPGYIDFALLLGTDFSQRIKNVGPARALKFIREHGSIERVLERERQYPPRIPEAEYLQQVQLARDVFQTLPPTPDRTLLQQGEVDEDAVLAILEKYGLSRYVQAEDWDYGQALAGNYFSDNPIAE